MAQSSPPRIDHLVLPVNTLGVARARHRALGFTVAPDGLHPFGTANACVYLADGVFLEPLAVADAQAGAEAARAGNVFVARDRSFRDTVAEEGCSALVLATSDARADHDGFRARGISAGPMLEFSRPFVDATGLSDTASFRLAFAKLADARASFLFSCERLNAPRVDRAALCMHANGAEGLAGVTLVAEEPHAALNAVATIAQVTTSSRGLLLGGARLDCLRADEYALRYAPLPAHDDPGYTLLTFRIRDAEVTRACLVAAGIRHVAGPGALFVPRAAGQGVDYLFEEAR